MLWTDLKGFKSNRSGRHPTCSSKVSNWICCPLAFFGMAFSAMQGCLPCRTGWPPATAVGRHCQELWSSVGEPSGAKRMPALYPAAIFFSCTFCQVWNQWTIESGRRASGIVFQQLWLEGDCGSLGRQQGSLPLAVQSCQQDMDQKKYLRNVKYLMLQVSSPLEVTAGTHWVWLRSEIARLFFFKVIIVWQHNLDWWTCWTSATEKSRFTSALKWILGTSIPSIPSIPWYQMQSPSQSWVIHSACQVIGIACNQATFPVSVRHLVGRRDRIASMRHVDHWREYERESGLGSQHQAREYEPY